jgi:hypothetical protein
VKEGNVGETVTQHTRGAGKVVRGVRPTSRSRPRGDWPKGEPARRACGAPPRTAVAGAGVRPHILWVEYYIDVKLARIRTVLVAVNFTSHQRLYLYQRLELELKILSVEGWSTTPFS